MDYQCKAILNREQFGSHRFSLNPKQILKEFLVYRFLRKKYKNARQRYLGFDGKKEITSRIPSYQIAEILSGYRSSF